MLLFISPEYIDLKNIFCSSVSEVQIALQAPCEALIRSKSPWCTFAHNILTWQNNACWPKCHSAASQNPTAMLKFEALMTEPTAARDSQAEMGSGASQRDDTAWGELTMSLVAADSLEVCSAPSLPAGTRRWCVLAGEIAAPAGKAHLTEAGVREPVL